MINRLLKLSAWFIWLMFSQDDSYLRMTFNFLGAVVVISSWFYRVNFGIAFGGLSRMLRDFIKGMTDQFNDKKDRIDDKMQEKALAIAETVGKRVLCPERMSAMTAPMKAERAARAAIRTGRHRVCVEMAGGETVCNRRKIVLDSAIYDVLDSASSEAPLSSEQP